MMAVQLSLKKVILTFLLCCSQVMHMLMEGNKERTQEPTAANKTSSRSHAILQVCITNKCLQSIVLEWNCQSGIADFRSK